MTRAGVIDGTTRMKINLRNGRYLDVDVERLARQLARDVDGEVRFDHGARALYSTDSSNYRQIPIGVIVPRTKAAAIAAVGVCREHGVPITSRGAGTSLAGQCCNVAVILDISKYLHRIIDLDPERKLARVEPGVVLDQLRNAAAKYQLTFSSDTSTHEYATIGGSIGNNACGVHSIMSGRTSDNVHELEIVTYDGLHTRVGRTPDDEYVAVMKAGGRKAEIYRTLRALRDDCAELVRTRYPKIPRRVSGYNLDDLLPEHDFHVARSLVGSEGTCALTLEATMNLVYDPPCRTLAVFGYPDIYIAADHVPALMACGPIGLEAVDGVLIAHLRRKHLHLSDLEILPDGDSFLLAEFGGDSQEEATAAARRAIGPAEAVSHELFEDRARQKTIWTLREAGLPATARVPASDDTWEGWEDSAVAPEDLGKYLRDLRQLYDQYHYDGAFYGHFGQGLVHTRINFGLRTADGIRKFHAFLDDATDLIVRYRGSYSGEHGDGQARAEFLPKLYGPELIEAFRRFKGAWDPTNRMNPGKVVDPYRADENLRLGTNYNPVELPTKFRYPEDHGSFAYAMERCVGVGKCRRTESGTMCPSFMVTRDEMHSTRGRARLLFELLQGEAIGDGRWRDEHVHEALDLCLSCKACKGECPMSVDMATYKAEFLSHYYEGRLRPRAGYAMGMIFRWARAASLAPGLVNAIARAPGLSGLVKLAGGIAPERQLPPFSRQTFRSWFAGRAPTAGKNGQRSSVLLWTDTFTNYFYPAQGVAATKVLEALGFDVRIPRENLCCGRPLYDYGWIDPAKRKLLRILEALRPDIRAGVPMIGLEPSCTSVFRDELVNLLPHDQDARRLEQQTFSLAEFLEKRAGDRPLPQVRGPALVHLHCHHRGVVGVRHDAPLLARMGLDAEILDSGCCGMAGAFGFEREHYDVSIRCGERVLLPRVRETPVSIPVIADGFSCREQIAQTTGREALHLAQVLQRGLGEDRDRNR